MEKLAYFLKPILCHGSLYSIVADENIWWPVVGDFGQIIYPHYDTNAKISLHLVFVYVSPLTKTLFMINDNVNFLTLLTGRFFRLFELQNLITLTNDNLNKYWSYPPKGIYYCEALKQRAQAMLILLFCSAPRKTIVFLTKPELLYCYLSKTIHLVFNSYYFMRE